MGEANRKRQYADPLVEALTKKLVDEGKLVEAGWVGLKAMAVPADAPAIQLEEMRNAFFAGAQHVYSSIMTMLDPGEDPTEADLSRMDAIDKELRNFINNYTVRRLPAEGSA